MINLSGKTDRPIRIGSLNANCRALQTNSAKKNRFTERNIHGQNKVMVLGNEMMKTTKKLKSKLIGCL